jgi:DNA-binding transcriptional ArsR family regulator
MEPDALSAALSALSDPSRRAIVARLASGEATVTELTAPLGITMPAVSRHLKVLEQAGLIERRRSARSRPCRLRPQGFGEVQGWLAALRLTWEQRLDRLAALVEAPDAADETTLSVEAEVSDDE